MKSAARSKIRDYARITFYSIKMYIYIYIPNFNNAKTERNSQKSVQYMKNLKSHRKI